MPKARKARGLLALVAMSKTHAVSRHQVAITLWSSVERTIGLARLRDVLHDLRKELVGRNADFLEIQSETILFRPGAVLVVTPSTETPGTDHWADFMTELDGVDPALDRWLTNVRALSLIHI